MLNFSLDDQEIEMSPKEIPKQTPNYLFTKIAGPDNEDKEIKDSDSDSNPFLSYL